MQPSLYKSVLLFTILTLSGYGIIHAQQPATAPADYTGPRNFIRTWDAAAPVSDAGEFMARPVKDVKQATQYFDGLGRPVQTVVKQGSLATGSSATDIVSTTTYDGFGREAQKFLPIPSSENNGLFKTNINAQFLPAMQALYGTQGESNFYSQTVFESSPLNRVEETFAPGVSWAGTAGNSDPNQRHSVKVKYWINTAIDDVKIWDVQDGALGTFGSYAVLVSNNGGVYPAGELYKTVTVDERNKQVIEFKDKEGKVILKKVQLTSAPDDGNGKNYDDWLCTYYIYDDLGNLRCVIQPEAVKKMAQSNNWDLSNYLNEQCFRYEYDQRNRMIIKKVPGAAQVEMVYDVRDRLIMTQDGNLRTNGKWLVTKYDELNRPIQTGIWSGNGLTAQQHRDYVYNNSLVGYPVNATLDVLTETYYDNYNDYSNASFTASFDGSWNTYFAATNTTNWPYPVLPQPSTATKGMVTWTKTKVLDNSNTYLYSVIIYDDKGRVIQTKTSNISGGTDITTTQYSWAGQPLVVVQKQEALPPSGGAGGGQTTTTVSDYTYDDLGRVTNIAKRIANTNVNSGAMSQSKTIVKNEYDAIGQLKKKTLSPDYTGNGSNGLENLSYDYNIRGWLLGMNRDYARDANSTNYFGFDLGYDKQANNLVGNQQYAAAQYNGNIAGTVWKSKGNGEKRKYDFSYDAANRLMKAEFTQYAGGAFNLPTDINYTVKMGDGTDPTSAYYDNGNIRRMQQWGLKGIASVPIDDLAYEYLNGGNRLAKVTDTYTDAQTKLGDFKDGGNGAGDDYDYDVNGNLKKDENKGITGINYNYLNLPETITFSPPNNNTGSTRYITYIYDASGNKLKKEVIEVLGPGANKTLTTLYIGGSIYESKVTNAGGSPEADDYTNRLGFLQHEEGRIRYNPATATLPAGFAYDYFIKDHLGNIRMVLTDEQKADIYPNLSFEGAAGSADVQAQDAIWENASGNTISVAGVRTANPQAFQSLCTYCSPLQPGPNGLIVRSSTGKIGAGKLLKVMVGDKVKTSVQYYFSSVSSNPPPTGLTTLVNGLFNSLNNSSAVSSGIKGSGSTVATSVGNNVNAQSFFNNQSSNSSTSYPKAYLNVLFFDEQFKFDAQASSSKQVGFDGNPGQITDFVNGLTANKNGYCYIYISNESDDIVFFDNLTLEHVRGQMLEETHYYPFGLTMAGISSKAAGSSENRKKYNGIEYENAFDVNIGETFFRTHDSQLGRWWQIDPLVGKFLDLTPYNAMGNNPLNYIDPDGSYSQPIAWILNLFHGGKGIGYNDHGRHANGNWYYKTGPDIVEVDDGNGGKVEALQFAIIYGSKNEPFVPLAERQHATVGPCRDYLLTEDQKAANALKLKNDLYAIGKDVNGNDLPLTRLAKNPHFAGFAENLALPMIEAYSYFGGLAELKLLGKGTGAVAELSAAETVSFYRAMSNAEYAALESSGGLTYMPGKELFVSSEAAYSRAYLQKSGYDVLVKFDMKPGAMNYFNQVGVMHRTAAGASGWAERGSLLWKSEQGVMNLGIQQNTHLFNPWIQSFKPIP